MCVFDTALDKQMKGPIRLMHHKSNNNTNLILSDLVYVCKITVFSSQIRWRTNKFYWTRCV